MRPPLYDRKTQERDYSINNIISINTIIELKKSRERQLRVLSQASRIPCIISHTSHHILSHSIDYNLIIFNATTKMIAT